MYVSASTVRRMKSTLHLVSERAFFADGTELSFVPIPRKNDSNWSSSLERGMSIVCGGSKWT